MARQLRIEFEGAFYHVTSRGNLRGVVFFEDKDREIFLEILTKTKKRYRTFVDAGIAQEESHFKEIEAGIMLGRGKFKEKIRGILALFKRDEELPQLRMLAEEKSLEGIVKACGEYYELPRGELIRRRRSLRARQATIYLSKILSGRTNKAIGEYFCIKGMAVSRVIKATEEKIARDSILRQQIGELKERILSVR